MVVLYGEILSSVPWASVPGQHHDHKNALLCVQRVVWLSDDAQWVVCEVHFNLHGGTDFSIFQQTWCTAPL